MPNHDFTLSSVQEGQQHCLYLAGDVTRHQVVQVREQAETILSGLPANADISLDWSGVAGFDSSTLSLWLCLQRFAKHRGQSLKAKQAPDALLQSAQVVGLATLF